MAATGASPRLSPTVVVFDVNETLSDMAPMVGRFEDVGAPAQLAATWFAGLLRDGFALTAAGASAPFAVIGAQLLRTLLPGEALDRSLDEAVEHVMAGFAALEVHPDVPEGIRALAAGGGAWSRCPTGRRQWHGHCGEGRRRRAPGTAALGRGRRRVDARPGRLRERRRPARCGLHDLLLVAVHPWDIDGAPAPGCGPRG